MLDVVIPAQAGIHPRLAAMCGWIPACAGMTYLLLEEGKKVNYICTSERVGFERGMQIGTKRGKKIGEKLGEKRGERRGERRGEATMLLQLLESRFHSLPPQYLVLIQQAKPQQLLRWARRTLDAARVEDVFS